MQRINLHTWEELRDWLDQHSEKDHQYAFRGQSSNGWPLRTSLARQFLNHPVAPNQWRKRELKVYRIFRERLLTICPGLYDDWAPLDILSLMQHHGTPTRLLDFSFSAEVAAYFASKDAQRDCSIWVVDVAFLQARSAEQKFPSYTGPSHLPEYKIPKKHPSASILTVEHPHPRLVAQRGCFLVPGSISKQINHALLHSLVTLSEEMVLETTMRLKGRWIDHEYLFPDLDQIARDANRFAVTGSAELPSKYGTTKQKDGQGC